MEQDKMLFDEGQILQFAEGWRRGGGGKYANAKMQKLRGVLFCTKHSLALASGTWMFTEAGCLDTDIYMRLLIVSQLGWHPMKQ